MLVRLSFSNTLSEIEKRKKNLTSPGTEIREPNDFKHRVSFHTLIVIIDDTTTNKKGSIWMTNTD